MEFWRRLIGSGRTQQRASASGGGPVLPSRSAVRVVTMDTALGLSGIFRAIQLLAGSAGQLELYGLRAGRLMARTPLLLERPDVDRSRRSFIKRTVIALAGTGNAYWRVYRDPSGFVSTVRALDPLYVFVGRDAAGRRYFDWQEPFTGRPVQRLQPVTDKGRSGDVLHLRLLEVPGCELGLGPIQACRVSIQGGLDLRDYSDNFFHSGEVPNGVLSTQQQLTKDDADRYRDRWREAHQDGHGVAVLGAGLEYAPIMLKPADAQWLESRQFNITEQARMFGIPAPLLLAAVDGSTMTYQNMEHVDLQLLKHTVTDYLDVIADGFSELLPAGTEAAFNPFSALRSDNKTRAEINQIYVELGVKSREQVAQEEGLPAPPPAAPVQQQTDQEGQPA